MRRGARRGRNFVVAVDGPAPDLSVILTVFNMARYVEEAARSLLAIPGVSIEVIAWDDGSTDGSGDILRAIDDPRLRVIQGPGQGNGACFAYNGALAEARADYVCRCDTDDRIHPDGLARQYRWLVDHPEYGAVAGGFAVMDEHGREVCVMDTGDGAEEITSELRNGIARTHFNTFVTRRDVLQRLGGFRPFFVNAHDVDMQLRIGEACRVWYNPWPSYAYRLHDRSMCHTFDAEKMKKLDYYVVEFQKQRQSRGQDDLELGLSPELPEGPQVQRNSAREHMYSVLMGRVWSYHRKGARRDAVKAAIRLCTRFPRRFDAWKNLALCSIKPAGKTD